MTDWRRDKFGELRYDLCPRCHRRKSIKSRLCQACEGISRPRGRNVPPPLDSLHYFPQGRDRRFCLLAVAGHSITNSKIGVSFSILDSHRCFEEVETTVAPLHKAQDARRSLIRKVQRMNRELTV